MLIGIFDQKKGSKVEDMLKALPQQNLYVLDSLVNLFDYLGEEKALTFDQILEETLGYCKNYGLQKIDQQQLLNALDELEYYSFIADPKKSIKLKV